MTNFDILNSSEICYLITSHMSYDYTEKQKPQRDFCKYQKVLQEEMKELQKFSAFRDQ
jgi:hypothetical protein